jgi:hypothetical protein
MTGRGSYSQSVEDTSTAESRISSCAGENFTSSSLYETAVRACRRDAYIVVLRSPTSSEELRMEFWQDAGHGFWMWIPHSSFCPPHRPDRSFDLSSGSDVHGSQPMLV